MDSNIVISARHLGKCFTIYDRPLDRLKQSIFRKKQFYRHFWALQNANFDIHQGEVIGIIGRNGSGKSTLLQLLCKTLTATTGTIDIKGRIAALLELGAGFNPEFTGRENVYMNGAILGFSKKEMDDRFEEIISFADIGDHIDQPVKTYSSGMYVRLAFAIQICVDPDILIVDEALSVGDIFFQQKCMQKFHQLKEQKKTLLIVSHDTTLMRDMCDRIIYLHEGKLCYYGDTTTAIYFYLNNLDMPAVQQRNAPNQVNNDEDAVDHSLIISKVFKTPLWKNLDLNNYKELEVKLIALQFNEREGLPCLEVTMANKMKIQILYWVNSTYCMNVMVQIKNRLNQIITCFKCSSKQEQRDRGYYVAEVELDCMIEAGQYTFAVCLIRSDGSPNNLTPLDTTPWLGPLTVSWDFNLREAPFLGMFGLPHQVKIFSLDTKPLVEIQ